MNIVEFLAECNVPVKEFGTHHHATANRVQADCPLCSPNTGRFRLGISLSGKFASCWTCGPVRVVEALRLLTNRPWQEIRKLLGALPASRREVKHRGKLELPSGLGPLLRPHRDYLRQRGFDPARLQRLWGIQGTGMLSELPWRIFIPIAVGGETVSWTTRELNDDGKRYHSARPDQEAISHKHTLFGLDYIRHSVIICEGVFDAMAIGPGAVALFGVLPSSSQMLLLKRCMSRAVVLDSDPVGQRQARALCNHLSVLPGKTANVVLPYKDAALTMLKQPDEIKQLRKAFLD